MSAAENLDCVEADHADAHPYYTVCPTIRAMIVALYGES